MKSIAIGNAIVCEYIAAGDRGKQTLVNTYAGDIQVQELPATFPLAFYIELLPDGSKQRNIDIDVLVGDRSVAKAVIDQREIQAGGVGLLALPALPMEFPGETEIKVMLSSKGFRKTEAIRKKIVKASSAL